jgi:hypothetical protein
MSRVQASQNMHVKYLCYNSEFGSGVTQTCIMKTSVLIIGLLQLCQVT